MASEFEFSLKLTREDITTILDHSLGQRMDQEVDDMTPYLKIAECIKAENLTDEFCNDFVAHLGPIVKQLIGPETDSYAMNNFHHEMLRHFAYCAKD